MLHTASVAPNRNTLPHYVHVSGTGCTHLLALMVFIHETHVMSSSLRVIMILICGRACGRSVEDQWKVTEHY